MARGAATPRVVRGGVMLILASDEVQRGWGGPVAILAAVIICAGFVAMMRKIDNPSPTAGEGEGWSEEQQVTGVWEHDPLPLPRGDVDHDDAELDQWLIENAGDVTWRDLVAFGATEFDVPRKHVIDRVRALGLYL